MSDQTLKEKIEDHKFDLGRRLTFGNDSVCLIDGAARVFHLSLRDMELLSAARQVLLTEIHQSEKAEENLKQLLEETDPEDLKQLKEHFLKEAENV